MIWKCKCNGEKNKSCCTATILSLIFVTLCKTLRSSLASYVKSCRFGKWNLGSLRGGSKAQDSVTERRVYFKDK